MACDVYSFGVIMYELLTYRYPFENMHREQVSHLKLPTTILMWSAQAVQKRDKVTRRCFLSCKMGHTSRYPSP